ncbi:MAG: glycosyl transferase group 1 [Myxococcaceae bacterium]|nr:glycosyl transferase group 1 [Myxococcaceae bacterium]
MRTLHVAALPFPSSQGTQALLHQMLCALSAAGHDTHLLCYAHGARVVAPAYTVHRIAAQSCTRSLRSGPSLDKLRLDASLTRRLAELVRQLAPAQVVAHHVEAAASALALGIAPLTFVAHTSLAAELPVYFPRVFSSLTSRLGRQVDSALVRRAARTLAVSPLLASMLSADSARPVESLPLPWPLAPRRTRLEGIAARAQLGLDSRHEVALYAGNLDGYQGLDRLLAGLAKLARQRPAFRLLIATAADSTRFASMLEAHALAARVLFCKLDDEAARRRAHAAADLALVPRRSPGGVPIKLLDAFARAVPVVAAERALAGLDAVELCRAIDGDCAEAWQAAISAGFDDLAGAQRRAELARAYVEREHTAERFVAALLR